MVDQITSHGPLQFNGYTRLVPVGPRLTRAEAISPENLTTARQPGMTMRRDGAGWQLYRALPQLVVCVLGDGRAGAAGHYTALALDNDAPQASPMSQDRVALHGGRSGGPALGRQRGSDTRSVLVPAFGR